MPALDSLNCCRTLQVGKHTGTGKLKRRESLLPFRVGGRDRCRIVNSASGRRCLLLILDGLAFPPSGHDHLNCRISGISQFHYHRQLRMR